MRLIGLAVVVAVGLTLASLGSDAQQTGKVWRIGYLTPAVSPRQTLIDALRELGYVEGQTARLELRTAENDLSRLPELAADLVRAQVDIIVAVSPPAIIAAKQATATIPVVMRFWGGEGLVESGVVASFTRPGGNVTGVYMFAAELDAKRLELLLQAVPKVRTVGVLKKSTDGGNSWTQYPAATFRCGLAPNPSTTPCPATDVRVDPQNPSDVYVAIRFANVFISHDGGNTISETRRLWHQL